MMTLDQFRATGTDCADLGETLGDECLAWSPGRIYDSGLYIEHWTDGRSGIAPPHGPTWLLTLFNEQWCGDLADMEQRLYQWACVECSGCEGWK